MLCTRHLVVGCMLVSTIASPLTTRSAPAAEVNPPPVIRSASMTKVGNPAHSAAVIRAVGPKGPNGDVNATDAQGPASPQGPADIKQKQFALLRWYVLTLLSVHQ